MLETFISRNEEETGHPFVSKEAYIETDIDQLSDVNSLMRAAPDYYRPKFDAMAEERKVNDGHIPAGDSFFKVASLVNVPLFMAMEIVQPGFMKDKKEFYRWLARHQEYKAYDRRGADHPTETFVGGVPVRWNVTVPEKQAIV